MTNPRQLLTACLVCALILGAWVARNAAVMGKATFSTNTGVNLWIGNHDGATGYYVNALLTGDELTDEREAMTLATAYMVAHPLETARRWGAKLGYLLDADNTLLVHPLLWLGNFAYHYTLLIAALVLPVLCVWRRRRVSVLPALLIAAGCVMPLAFFAVERFGFALMPLVALYAAVTVRGLK